MKLENVTALENIKLLTAVFHRLSRRVHNQVRVWLRNTFDVCETQQGCVLKPYELFKHLNGLRFSLIFMKCNCYENNKQSETRWICI